MEWPRLAIGDVCVPTEQCDPRVDPDSEFRYVDITGIDRKHKRIAEPQLLHGSEAPSRARKVIRHEDVLVSTVRPNLNAVAMVPQDLDGEIASTGFCVLRANRAFVEPRYLFYRAISPDFVAELSAKVRGANYPAVSDRDVKDVRIPLPPLSEQRRIVEILDQADRLRRLRAEADAKAERIVPALFIKMFGDPLRLLSHPAACPLNELNVDFQNGFACGDKDVPGGMPHLRMNNISDSGRLDLTVLRTVPAEKDGARYRLQDGDVLFMGTNSVDKIGKSCVFRPADARTYLFSNHLIRIRCATSDLVPEYLATFLHLLWRSRFYPEIAKRWVNQATVSRQALGTVRVPTFDRSRQERFASAQRQLEKHVIAASASAERLSSLFTQLSHRAFSGSLTTSWREAHMKELLQEMEQQAETLVNG